MNKQEIRTKCGLLDSTEFCISSVKNKLEQISHIEIDYLKEYISERRMGRTTELMLDLLETLSKLDHATVAFVTSNPISSKYLYKSFMRFYSECNITGNHKILFTSSEDSLRGEYINHIVYDHTIK